MPKRICLGTPNHPCRTLVDAALRRCERCRSNSAAQRNARPIAQLYASAAYKAMRRHVFERDGYHCRYCGKPARSGDPLTLAHLDETQLLLANGDDPLNADRCVTAHRSCHAQHAPTRSAA